MQFVKLTEKNEWEGEDSEPGNPFTLDPFDKAKDESFVDAQVEQADEDEDGYMASDHKVLGVLTIPDDWKPGQGDEPPSVERALYKGGICKLFEQATKA